MKKYLQIGIVLALFGGLLLFRQLHGSDEQPVVGKQNTSAPTNTPVNSQSTPSSSLGTPTPSISGKYKDGTYTGPVTDAFYGNVQVQVVIRDGKITDVQFLQAPNDNVTTRSINDEATPILRQEAIQSQSAHVDIVSSASQTSNAFIQSLSAALQKAS